MRVKRRHSWILFFALSWALATPAQETVTYSAPVKTVNKSGFYKVLLSPGIVARTTRQMEDIRILTSDDKQVPYLMRTDLPVFRENNFLELKIVSTKKEADKLTHIIIQNIPGKATSELYLVVKNNDAFRSVTLSGSDDEKLWYVIKENIAFTSVTSDDTDRYVQLLEFPKSNYLFFKIIINGKDLLPINIVKAGIFEDVSKNGKYIPNPAPSVMQKDSGKNSYVQVHFARPYRSDQLEFDISGPKYYQRTLHVYETEKSVKGYQQDFLVRSGQPASFDSYFKSSDLEIIIENDDNPALKINSVKSFQLSKYLLAFLDSAKEYHLVFGDLKLGAPTYDIAYFKDSLQNTNITVETGEITALTAKAGAKTDSGLASTIIMWVIIAAVLALLLLLTMRMTKEVNNKKDQGN